MNLSDYPKGDSSDTYFSMIETSELETDNVRFGEWPLALDRLVLSESFN